MPDLETTVRLIPGALCGVSIFALILGLVVLSGELCADVNDLLGDKKARR